MRLRQRWLWLIAICVGSAAFGGWTLVNREEVDHPERTSTPTEVRSHEAAMNLKIEAGTTSTQVLTARRPNENTSVTLAKGMLDPNPLAFVTQQHALAKPGSFANAEQVTYQCREANQHAAKARAEDAVARAVSLGRDPAAFQARFIQAQQAVRSRCGDFRHEVPADRPLEADAYAAKFSKARSGLFKMDEDFAANLIELASQGQMASAYFSLATLPRFQGESFSSPEDKAIFREAVRLAAFKATSVDGDQGNDLRTLTACLATGVCDGSFESYALINWPEGSVQREKALALSKRMEAVFRANDIRAWIERQ